MAKTIKGDVLPGDSSEKREGGGGKKEKLLDRGNTCIRFVPRLFQVPPQSTECLTLR